MQDFGRFDRAEQLDQPGDRTGPTGLMAGAQTGTVVAMKVLVEHQQVSPVRIALKRRHASVNRSAAAVVSAEDRNETIGDLFGHLEQGHLASRTGWTLDDETVAVVEVVVEQGSDDEQIDGKPNRTSPVGISAEQSAV